MRNHKPILLFIVFTFSSLLTIAQNFDDDFENIINEKTPVKKGDFVLDLWYGGPNIERWIFPLFDTANVLADYTIKGLGPLGVSFEYLIIDEIGIMVEYIHNALQLKWKEKTFAPSGSPVIHQMTYSYERHRIHLRINYHFYKGKKLEMYIGLGGGTNKRVDQVTSTPYHPSTAIWNNNDDIEFIPFSLRTCIGGHYYITPSIGLMVELGLGGGLLRGGLTIKL